MRRVFIFTATITSNTQSLAGANRNVVQAVDFLIALFLGWGKVTLPCEQRSLISPRGFRLVLRGDMRDLCSQGEVTCTVEKR